MGEKKKEKKRVCSPSQLFSEYHSRKNKTLTGPISFMIDGGMVFSSFRFFAFSGYYLQILSWICNLKS